MISWIATAAAILLTSPAVFSNTEAAPALDLTPKLLELSYIAADVSVKAYDNPESGQVYPDYDKFTLYSDELFPNQYAVAQRDGHCYLGFRGTSESFVDLFQNFLTVPTPIHKDNDPSQSYCMASFGFTTFLNGTAGEQAFQAIDECVESYCKDPEECLVITGHSKGGGQSTVASIALHRYNPTVITFGGIASVMEGCPHIPEERTYRYINTIEDSYVAGGIVFDMVPFLDRDHVTALPWPKSSLLEDDNEGETFPSGSAAIVPSSAPVAQALFKPSASVVASETKVLTAPSTLTPSLPDSKTGSSSIRGAVNSPGVESSPAPSEFPSATSQSDLLLAESELVREAAVESALEASAGMWDSFKELFAALNQFHVGDHFGHAIVLSDDHKNVKYFGWNKEEFLTNTVYLGWNTGKSTDDIAKVHTVDNYNDRIRSFVQANNANIGSSGFREGIRCDYVYFRDLCESGICGRSSGVCVA